jgi:acyl-CoA thioester hydrolase
MKESITLRVRFAETDAMGVVYHSRYFEFLEMARVALMDTMGLPYSEMSRSGYHLPVLELHGKYIHSASFDDELTVTVWIHTLKGIHMELRYTITKGSMLIFEGSTTHAFVNNAGRPCRPPEDVLTKFAQVVEKDTATATQGKKVL